MKILVSGSTGFTGGKLTKELVEKNHTVVALVRKTSNIDHLNKLGVDAIQGDITDPDSIKKAVKGVDKVYHLAAAWRDVGASDDVYWKVNFKGTQNLLEASLKENIDRFIHTSTMGVHGHVKNPPGNENSPYNPGDIYQRTKCEADKLALDYFNKRGLPGVVVRPAGIYGPGDKRFLPLFKAIKKGRFIMIGSGEVCYHFVYIDDLISGFLLCGEKEQALGNAYIIGGEGYISLNDLVALVSSILDVTPPKRRFPFFWPVWITAFVVEILWNPLNSKPPIFRRRIDWFRKNRAFDISKARSELGYEPKVDLITGLNKTYEWYKEQGYLD